ncbi:MAG: hypothetical protein AAGD43_10260 [Pseudomonadota bacterium]
MSENENRQEDSDDADLADNHKWADRFAVERQRGLERIGLIAIVVAGILAIVFSVW